MFSVDSPWPPVPTGGVAPSTRHVYPCAALLNHGCAPNCVLRYELGAAANDDGDGDGDGDATAGRYHPPILVIVACRDVMAGEELRHSYVDLSLDTEARRARLFDTHGFVCECERCGTAGGGGDARSGCRRIGTIGTFGPCGMDFALTGGKVSPNGQSRAWCECELTMR